VNYNLARIRDVIQGAEERLRKAEPAVNPFV